MSLDSKALTTTGEHVSAPRGSTGPSAKVLDEDTYVTALEAIIQRDFFPDLSKLRNQYDWSVASAAGDIQRMNEIQLEYRHKRELAPDVDEIPDWTVTPRPPKRARLDNFDDDLEDADTDPNRQEGQDVVDLTSGLTLDQFLNRYTSEDNASFSTIMHETKERQKQKNWWMHDKTKQQLLLDSSAARMAIMWPADHHNSLMHFPTGVTPTVNPDAARPQYVPANTRIDPASITQPAPKLDKADAELGLISDTEYSIMRAANRQKKKDRVDLNALRGLTDNTEHTSASDINPFALIPEPDVDAYANSTITTWGVIEGTPLRLDGGATPRRERSKKKESDKLFAIPQTPLRDQIALDLADETQRKRLAERAKKQQNPMTPRSAAGQRLQERLMQRNKSGMDSQLRQSYTPISNPNGPSTPTPRKFNTPG